MSPSVDTQKGRYYPWRNDKYVSVTTAISEGLPKPQLNRWFVRSMAQTAALFREELAQKTEEEAYEWLLAYRAPTDGLAAALGSTVHAAAERISQGKPYPTPTPEQLPYVKAFERFLKKRKPRIIEAEVMVFSRTHGYAGTMDALMEMDGEIYVVDYKTGKGVWPEAALQLAAYRHADFIGRADGREEPVPASSGSFVLHLRPTGYQVIPVATGPDVFDTFLSTLDMFRWITSDSAFAIKR